MTRGKKPPQYWNTALALGRNLKIWRQRNGYSQAEVAERLGVKQHQLSRYENGKCCLQLADIITIAHKFHERPLTIINFAEEII